MINQPEFGPMLAEGKTKIIYAYPDNDTLAYMVNKDQITAGDGARRNELVGKSVWSTITTANVFSLLNQEELETHFLEKINDTTLLIKRCTM
ncbi:MAG TPA: phosphoribosylaminoimidazolesuccinocarboxamide synthase, partial [Ktedonobacter sp.]|nr:phosphoribosylaminoimidazolesuccinocarboxamide synthase [Ktedonobacter sp.]